MQRLVISIEQDVNWRFGNFPKTMDFNVLLAPTKLSVGFRQIYRQNTGCVEGTRILLFDIYAE
jgi:hypothetical protein